MYKYFSLSLLLWGFFFGVLVYVIHICNYKL